MCAWHLILSESETWLYYASQWKKSLIFADGNPRNEPINGTGNKYNSSTRTVVSINLHFMRENKLKNKNYKIHAGKHFSVPTMMDIFSFLQYTTPVRLHSFLLFGDRLFSVYRKVWNYIFLLIYFIVLL